MKKITADEFLAMIKETPSMFENWDTPLEITEFVNCDNTKITHLSPYLTFSGTSNGRAASFSTCRKLHTVAGNFHGFVNFEFTNTKTIQNLKVENQTGMSASFFGCKNLETAAGTYSNYVSFCDTGIHSIHNLHIQNINSFKNYADFERCPNLKNLEGWDLSKQIKIEPEKLLAEKERRALLKFHNQTQPQELPFL
jgi:hypothetical protein